MDTNEQEKFELFGIPVEKLAEKFSEIGDKPFRAKQACKWIYAHGLFDFQQMTDMPKKLRDWLGENAVISLPELVEIARADDASSKFLFELDDGNLVEAVHIPDIERAKQTVCLSSQVGCKLGCAFCATGQMGFVRNLSSTEIVGQLYHLCDYVRQGGNEITNIVFMGMGEPLDNLPDVLDSIRVMLSDVGFGIGHRKVLISTVGIPEGIREIMGTGLRPKIAISLNAPDNELRSRLMPVNKKYPIESWLPLIPEYAQYSRRWVTFEYVLLDGINDSLECAEKLRRLMQGLPVKVNLIPFNNIVERRENAKEFERPDMRTVLRFQSYLLTNGIVATIRISRGSSIFGACGQLAGRRLEI